MACLQECYQVIFTLRMRLVFENSLLHPGKTNKLIIGPSCYFQKAIWIKYLNPMVCLIVVIKSLYKLCTLFFLWTTQFVFYLALYCYAGFHFQHQILEGNTWGIDLIDYYLFFLVNANFYNFLTVITLVCFNVSCLWY